MPLLSMMVAADTSFDECASGRNQSCPGAELEGSEMTINYHSEIKTQNFTIQILVLFPH